MRAKEEAKPLPAQPVGSLSIPHTSKKTTQVHSNTSMKLIDSLSMLPGPASTSHTTVITTTTQTTTTKISPMMFPYPPPQLQDLDPNHYPLANKPFPADFESLLEITNKRNSMSSIGHDSALEVR
jgi:hypothetical protein